VFIHAWVQVSLRMRLDPIRHINKTDIHCASGKFQLCYFGLFGTGYFGSFGIDENSSRVDSVLWARDSFSARR
jgi:hypothetical protein